MSSKENHRKKWSNSELKELKVLANKNTPTGIISLKLGRTPDAVRTKASEEKISLHPTNKPPYDRKVSES
jgi:hypothetical protein